jgi:hypothetical protein
MQLSPRWEARDFRDVDRRQHTEKVTAWDRVKKGVNILGATAFVGLTLYNLYIMGEWLSGWYAKRRAARAGHWKRDHPREWNKDSPSENTKRY